MKVNIILNSITKFILKILWKDIYTITGLWSFKSYFSLCTLLYCHSSKHRCSHLMIFFFCLSELISNTLCTVLNFVIFSCASSIYSTQMTRVLQECSTNKNVLVYLPTQMHHFLKKHSHAQDFKNLIYY